MKKSAIYILISIVLIIVISIIYINNKSNKEIDDFKRPDEAFLASYYSVFKKYQDEDPLFHINKVNTIKQKEKFDEKLREKIIELLNMPLEKIPTYQIPGSEINKIDKGKYIQKKISILTSKNTVANAYLLVPKNISFPAPAVIAMHQHGGTKYGKEEVVGNIGDPNLFYGKELAEKGYIVFAMDSFLFGERQLIDNNSNEIVETIISQRFFNLGHPPLGLIVQEDLVSLDFVNSLDFVDKENIGCIGHSFGGVRCMYLSALDKRVKSVVLSSSVSEMKLNLDTGILYSWLTVLPGIERVTETSGILALIAPRPLMVVYTEKDPIYLPQDAQNTINEVRRIYKLTNQNSNFISLFIPNSSHEFPLEYHEKAYQFFDQTLKRNI